MAEETLTPEQRAWLREQICRRMGIEPESIAPSPPDEPIPDEMAIYRQLQAEIALEVGKFYRAEVTGNWDDEAHVSTVYLPDEGVWETVLFDVPEYDADSINAAHYNTREEAEAGHAEWVRRMTANELPNPIMDVWGSEYRRMT